MKGVAGKRKMLYNIFYKLVRISKPLLKSVKTLISRAREDYISAHSGHSALFIIISVFPLLILMLAFINHTEIGKEPLMNFLDSLAPKGLQGDIFASVSGLLERLGNVAVSVTILTLLWSASGFVYSITLGLNRIYRYKDRRNYFLLRGISLVYTLLFLLLLMVMAGLSALISQAGLPTRFSSIVEGVFSFIAVTFVSTLFYSFIPQKKSGVLTQLPGALFTALGWYGFSFVYPVYLKFSQNVSYIYGGLSMAILWLWWLYFSMYIFYIGAEVNMLLTAQQICFRKKRGLKNEQV